MLRPRLLPLLFLGCAVLFSGCGKGGPKVVHTGGLNPVAPIAPAGAAGQVTKNTTRLGGSSPAEDAAAVATAVHPPGQPPETVVLVNQSDLGLALAASVLVGQPLNAALLYSEAGGMPAPTEAALKGLSPSGAKALEGAQILTVGGAAAPSSYKARSLPGTGEAGQAASLLKVQEGLTGTAPKRVLVVDAKTEPAYALPAAALAAGFGTPILLVERNGVPQATAEALAALHHPKIYVIGPPKAVSEAVLRRLAGFGSVKRIAAETPAEQSVTVSRFSEEGFGFGILEPGHGLAFVDGRDPLDAPAAAALATAGDFAPTLVLESPSTVPQPIVTYLEDIRGAYSNTVPPYRSLYNHGWIVGGAEAISLAVQDRIDGLLEITKRATATPSPAYAPEGG